MNKEEIEKQMNYVEGWLKTHMLVKEQSRFRFNYEDIYNMFHYIKNLQIQVEKYKKREQKLIDKLESDKMEQFDDFNIYLI